MGVKMKLLWESKYSKVRSEQQFKMAHNGIKMGTMGQKKGKIGSKWTHWGQKSGQKWRDEKEGRPIWPGDIYIYIYQNFRNFGTGVGIVWLGWLGWLGITYFDPPGGLFFFFALHQYIFGQPKIHGFGRFWSSRQFWKSVTCRAVDIALSPSLVLCSRRWTTADSAGIKRISQFCKSKNSTDSDIDCVRFELSFLTKSLLLCFPVISLSSPGDQ